MKSQLSNILKIIGIVAILGTVVYLKTQRKMNRYQNEPSEEQQKFNDEIIEFSKKREREARDLERSQEQLKQDSIRKAQRNELDKQIQKAKEALKKLEQEQN